MITQHECIKNRLNGNDFSILFDVEHTDRQGLYAVVSGEC
jgi:hypothetical protein